MQEDELRSPPGHGIRFPTCMFHVFEMVMLRAHSQPEPSSHHAFSPKQDALQGPTTGRRCPTWIILPPCNVNKWTWVSAESRPSGSPTLAPAARHDLPGSTATCAPHCLRETHHIRCFHTMQLRSALNINHDSLASNFSPRLASATRNKQTSPLVDCRPSSAPGCASRRRPPVHAPGDQLRA